MRLSERRMWEEHHPVHQYQLLPPFYTAAESPIEKVFGMEPESGDLDERESAGCRSFKQSDHSLNS